MPGGEDGDPLNAISPAGGGGCFGHRCRIVHAIFGNAEPGAPEVRSGWYCVTCGRSIVRGWPPLPEDLRLAIEVLCEMGMMKTHDELPPSSDGQRRRFKPPEIF